MKFILIVFIVGNGQSSVPAIHSVEFTSEQNCQLALNEFEKYKRPYYVSSIVKFCTPG